MPADMVLLQIFNLDVKTIIGLLFMGNLILGFLVFAFLIAQRNQDNKRELLWYIFSKVFQAAAWLLIYLRGNIPDWISVNLGNSFLFISYNFESGVMLGLLNSPRKFFYRVQTIILVVVIIVFNTIELFYSKSAYIRVASSSIAVFLVIIMPVILYLIERNTHFFKKIFGITYSVFAILLFMRFFNALHYKNISIFTNSSFQYTVFLNAFLMMVVSGIGFLLLVKEKQDKKINKLLVDKDKFISIIAHDLKNPFHSIIGFSSLLRENIHELSSEEINEYVHNIQSASQNTYNLLEHLLEWASTHTGRIDFKPRTLELDNVVNEVLYSTNSASVAKNINIKVNLNSITACYADGNMLKTILRNIISNAIKYTRVNGTIKILVIKTRKSLQFSITDNGVGMSHDKVKKLFKINEKISTPGTHQEQGTGLGLLLCKEFVDKHKGKIWVESEENTGTTFYFTLPQTQK